MNIKSVKLKSDGFKGADVQYILPETKGNRFSNTPVKKSPQDPIHKDLENLFKDLRPYLLDICQMNTRDESEMKFVILETKVTGIEFDSDGFVLHGEREVFGNKEVKLKTPKVEEIDNFYGYENVKEIISQIIAETKLYLEGDKKVSDEELAQRWVEAGKDKAMTMEVFNGLSADERRDFATQLLENEFGSIVIHSGETVDNQDVMEISQSFEIGGEEPLVIPLGGNKKSKSSKANVEADKSNQEAKELNEF